MSPFSKKIPLTVRLNWLNQSQFAGFYVAQEKNFYAKKGIQVFIKERDFSKPSPIEELIAGKVDFLLVSPIEFLRAVSEGKKIKAIAAFFQENPAVIVSIGKNTLKTPKDLVGKNLGVTSDSSGAKFIFQDLLYQFGLSDNSIKYKVVGANQVEHLLDGDVDAVIVYRSNEYLQLVNKGHEYSILKPEEYGTSTYSDVLVTTEKNISERPSIVSRFLQATIEGWQYAIHHTKETIDIVYPFANKAYKNKNDLDIILFQTIKLIRPDELTLIGRMNYIKWKVLENKMIAHNMLTKPIKTINVFTNYFFDH